MLETLKRWWNKPGDELDAAFAAAIAAEREACAKVCDAEADSMEQGAQRAIESGEHDEVSAIRSAAWKLSVTANRIRARSNDEVSGRAA
ncbi:MAG: hypothetical protein KA440_08435 [Azonexus sp.]|nr:hypothetical protein [Azonexus sp.]